MAFSRDDITDAFLTHLHFDHCGGSIGREGEKLVPAFKNATYWSNKAHWDWAVQPNEREKASFLKENILPIEESGQLSYMDVTGSSEGKLGETRFTENISVRFVNGHTESNDAAPDKIQGQDNCFHGRPVALGGSYTVTVRHGLRYVSAHHTP